MTTYDEQPGRVTLVMGAQVLQEVLALSRLASGREYGLGLLHLPEHSAELLVRPYTKEATGRLQIGFGSLSASLSPQAQRFLDNPELGLAAVLTLDMESAPPRAAGWVRWGLAPVRPLDSLRVLGLGLKDQALRPLPLLDPYECLAEEERARDRSRLQGAITQTAWDALQSLRILVVGCGGLGSCLADHLTRLLGSEGEIALLDGDTLESGNASAWLDPALAETHSGWSKAVVLAERLSGMPGGPQVSSLPGCLDSMVASVLAVKTAQVVVCCVDNPEARQTIARLCAFYERPLLVVETAVVLGESVAAHQALLADIPPTDTLPAPLRSDAPRLLLADVRLVLPWRALEHPGCLLCAGGVGEPVPGGPFWRGRAGTLPALNQEAVARGVRLLLSYLSGEVRQTTHLRLDEVGGADGQWRTIPHRPDWNCTLCTNIGGGDAAWKKEM